MSTNFPIKPTYFYHGIRDNLETLDKIFKRGAILCKEHIYGAEKCQRHHASLNGLEYISLARKLDSHLYTEFNSSYNMFVKNNISLIIEEDIPAIKTVLITEDIESLDDETLNNYFFPPDENRYSDLVDEWQVKGTIDLKHVIAIGVPYSVTLLRLSEMYKKYDHPAVKLIIKICIVSEIYQLSVKLKKITRLLSKYKLKIKIVDIEAGLEIGKTELSYRKIKKHF